MTEELIAAIRTSVAEDLADSEHSELDSDDRREYARQRIFSHIERMASIQIAAGSEPVSEIEERRIARAILDALFGLGRIQEYIDDPQVENIDINGSDHVWVTFSDGSKQAMPPIAASDDDLVELIRSAAARFGLSERRFDLARPELDLRLPDGSRLSALMAVTARPCLSIRRHRFNDLTLNDLVELGTLNDEIASLLSAIVKSRKNIVVAGAMNFGGKTTLLRALAAEIPARERIVTIEQAFELGLDTAGHRHPDMVAIEARPPNIEGEGMFSVADLVRRALRMNADRVIVGEVLGDEVLPMLNAMSQGRSGSMCTIHADSSAGVFRRIASYAVQAPERLPLEATNLLIAGAIHFVVFLDVEAHVSVDSDDATVQAWSSRSQFGSSPKTRRKDNDQGGDAKSQEADFADIRFESPARRQRFISSIREVVDAEGVQVISNEIYRPDAFRRAMKGAALRPNTAKDLEDHGYRFSGGTSSDGSSILGTGTMRSR